MSDAFLKADARWIAAQRGANRDLRQPVVNLGTLPGHLPDPWSKPEREPRHPLFWIGVGIAACLIGSAVACVWSVVP